MNPNGTVFVAYERKVSDGDYGNESATCHITADWGDEALTDGYLEALTQQLTALCRAAVQRQLAQSVENRSRLAAETLDERAVRNTQEAGRQALHRAFWRWSKARRAVSDAQHRLERAAQRAEERAGDVEALRLAQALERDLTEVETALEREAQILQDARVAFANIGGDVDMELAQLDDTDDNPF